MADWLATGLKKIAAPLQEGAKTLRDQTVQEIKKQETQKATPKVVVGTPLPKVSKEQQQKNVKTIVDTAKNVGSFIQKQPVVQEMQKGLNTAETVGKLAVPVAGALEQAGGFVNENIVQPVAKAATPIYKQATSAITEKVKPITDAARITLDAMKPFGDTVKQIGQFVTNPPTLKVGDNIKMGMEIQDRISKVLKGEWLDLVSMPIDLPTEDIAKAGAKTGLTAMGFAVDIIERPLRKTVLPYYFQTVTLAAKLGEKGYITDRDIEDSKLSSEIWAGGSLEGADKTAKFVGQNILTAMFPALATKTNAEDMADLVSYHMDTETKFREGAYQRMADHYGVSKEEVQAGINSQTIFGVPVLNVMDTFISYSASLAEARLAPVLKSIGLNKAGDILEFVSKAVYPTAITTLATDQAMQTGFLGDKYRKGLYETLGGNDPNLQQNIAVLEGIAVLGTVFKVAGKGIQELKAVSLLDTANKFKSDLQKWNQDPALVKQVLEKAMPEYVKTVKDLTNGKLTIDDLTKFREVMANLPPEIQQLAKEVNLKLFYKNMFDGAVAGYAIPANKSFYLETDTLRTQLPTGLEAKGTIPHELAHIFEKGIINSPEYGADWKALIDSKKFSGSWEYGKMGNVESDYMYKNPGEYFAEGVRKFINEPEVLKIQDEGLYKFMQKTAPEWGKMFSPPGFAGASPRNVLDSPLLQSVMKSRTPVVDEYEAANKLFNVPEPTKLNQGVPKALVPYAIPLREYPSMREWINALNNNEVKGLPYFGSPIGQTQMRLFDGLNKTGGDKYASAGDFYDQVKMKQWRTDMTSFQEQEGVYNLNYKPAERLSAHANGDDFLPRMKQPQDDFMPRVGDLEDKYNSYLKEIYQKYEGGKRPIGRTKEDPNYQKLIQEIKGQGFEIRQSPNEYRVWLGVPETAAERAAKSFNETIDTKYEKLRGNTVETSFTKLLKFIEQNKNPTTNINIDKSRSIGSKSRYIELDDGSGSIFKIRISDHDLPISYGGDGGYDALITPKNKNLQTSSSIYNLLNAIDDFLNPGVLEKKVNIQKQDPFMPRQFDKLAEEAKKYASAEEFVGAQFSKKPEYGMGHRPSWDGAPPAHNLLEGNMLPRDVYTHPDFSIASGAIRRGEKAANESWSALQKIKGKPDAEITIYRAGKKNQLNTGDWVTFSKKYAADSVEGAEKVYSFKVKAKDVLFAGDDINEFGYYPKSQLTDIWNKANIEDAGNFMPRVNPEEVPREMRLDKFNVGNKQEVAIEKIVEDLGLDVRTVKHFAEMEAGAEELLQSPEKLLMTANAKRLTDVETVALKQLVNDNYGFISNAEKVLARNESTNPRLLQSKINHAYDQITRSIQILAPGLTEQGRAVVANRIMASKTMDYSIWAVRAQKMLGADVKDERLKIVLDQVRLLTEAKDRLGLSSLMSSLGESTFVDKLVTLWKAGLLTAPSTHIRNVLSNSAFATLETVKDIPATMIDKLASAFTGKRTVTFTSLGDRFEGIPKGWLMAQDVMKYGSTLDNLGKSELYKKVNFSDSPLGKIADKYTKFVFNTLQAEDAIFKGMAENAALKQSAKVVAINEGLKGKSFDLRVSELVDKPTAEMAAFAEEYKLFATFNNKNILSDMASKARTAASKNPASQIVMESAIPFVRTPTNVAMRTLDYSPIGIVKGLYEAVLGKQQAAAMDLGRGITGSAIIALGALAAQKGIMTGTYPTKGDEKKKFANLGLRGGDLVVGDKAFNVMNISPIGNLMQLGASLYNNTKDQGVSGLQATAFDGLKGLTEQTFLAGLSNLLKAAQDPQQSASTYFSSAIAGMIPTVLAQLAESTDLYQREANDLTDRLLSRTPARSMLLPRLDTFGEPIESNQQKLLGSSSSFVSRALVRMFDPFGVRKLPDNVLLDEYERLSDMGVEKAYPATPSEKGTITVTKDNGLKEKLEYKMSDETYNIFREVTGKLMTNAQEELLQSPDYQALDDTAKAKKLYDIYETSRDTAKALVMPLIFDQPEVQAEASKLFTQEKIKDIRMDLQESKPVIQTKSLLPRSKKVNELLYQ